MSSPSSIASSATPTNTDSMENPAGGGSSSTLYLYTFLVTLILLLSVSIIIVGRSYLLRRRFRRQVEEALRNGHVLSPDAPGLIGLSNSITSKLLGPPPKLWDVWVQPATVTKPSFDTEVASSGKFPWTEVRPLSAEILPQNPRRSRMPPTLASRTSSNDSSIMLSKSWIRKRTSSSSVPTLNNTPVVAESLPEKNPCIRVVTLIAMPTPPSLSPNTLSRAGSDTSRSAKGKYREERFNLSPITVGVTELKVILEEEEEEANDLSVRAS